MTARDAFLHADREYLMWVQRVAAAGTGDPLRGKDPRVCEWAELNESLFHLLQAARVRHLAKHRAIREAQLQPVHPLAAGGDARFCVCGATFMGSTATRYDRQHIICPECERLIRDTLA